MTGKTKRQTLLLLGLVLLITMMIAATLPQLVLQPGMPMPSLQPGQYLVAPTREAQAVTISIKTFFLVLTALLLTGTLLYVTYQLLRGFEWKIIRDSLRYGLIVSVGIVCLVFLIMLLPASVKYTPEAIPLPTPQPVVTSPLGSAPPSLLWLVGIGLLVTSVFVLMWVFRPSPPSGPIDLVGQEAEKARQALHDGLDLKDVIIDCYLQMSRALKKEQGLEREHFMTTGEFERLLEAAGIPHEPIHQLTRLFDAARYGNWQPDSSDDRRAIQCLEAIMLHSRAMKARS